MMSTKRSLFWLFSLCFIGLSGCTKLDNSHYVPPITLYEKLQGSWMLTDVKQVDETAKVAGLKPDELSLYSQFDFSTFLLVLETDGDGQPTSYRVEGDAPALFAGSGSWDLDHPFPLADGTAPVIQLYQDADKTVLTGKLQVVSVPGTSPQMELRLTRYSEGVAFVSYHYQLTNLNQ